MSFDEKETKGGGVSLRTLREKKKKILLRPSKEIGDKTPAEGMCKIDRHRKRK